MQSFSHLAIFVAREAGAAFFREPDAFAA